MINPNLVGEIKRLIESLDIKTGKISVRKINHKNYGYYFSICEKDVGKFQDKIGFYHPNKQKRLNIKLKIKERNYIRRTRPLDWTRKRIIDLLKIRPRTTIELSNNLLLTIGGVYNHLNYLERDNKIQRSGYKNKCLWLIN